MPGLNDLRNKTSIPELYSCPDFQIDGVLFPGNRLHIHVQWPGKPKLTPRLYRLGQEALGIVKRAAAEHGIPAIYVLVPVSLVKWETMFGFEPIEEWTNRLGSENLILMKQATS